MLTAQGAVRHDGNLDGRVGKQLSVSQETENDEPEPDAQLSRTPHQLV